MTTSPAHPALHRKQARVPFRVRHRTVMLGFLLIVVLVGAGVAAWLLATRTHHRNRQARPTGTEGRAPAGADLPGVHPRFRPPRRQQGRGHPDRVGLRDRRPAGHEVDDRELLRRARSARPASASPSTPPPASMPGSCGSTPTPLASPRRSTRATATRRSPGRTPAGTSISLISKVKHRSDVKLSAAGGEDVPVLPPVGHQA